MLRSGMDSVSSASLPEWRQTGVNHAQGPPSGHEAPVYHYLAYWRQCSDSVCPAFYTTTWCPGSVRSTYPPMIHYYLVSWFCQVYLPPYGPLLPGVLVQSGLPTSLWSTTTWCPDSVRSTYPPMVTTTWCPDSVRSTYPPMVHYYLVSWFSQVYLPPYGPLLPGVLVQSGLPTPLWSTTTWCPGSVRSTYPPMVHYYLVSWYRQVYLPPYGPLLPGVLVQSGLPTPLWSTTTWCPGSVRSTYPLWSTTTWCPGSVRSTYPPMIHYYLVSWYRQVYLPPYGPLLPGVLVQSGLPTPLWSTTTWCPGSVRSTYPLWSTTTWCPGSVRSTYPPMVHYYLVSWLSQVCLPPYGPLLPGVLTQSGLPTPLWSTTTWCPGSVRSTYPPMVHYYLVSWFSQVYLPPYGPLLPGVLVQSGLPTPLWSTTTWCPDSVRSTYPLWSTTTWCPGSVRSTYPPMVITTWCPGSVRSTYPPMVHYYLVS